MFDGKRINNRERMVVVAQFLDSEGRPCEKFVALKSFSDDDSITGQRLFDAMVDELFDRDFLFKVHSSMSDTTAVNTGCRKGINTRLQDYFNRELHHDIHAFQCLLHIKSSSSCTPSRCMKVILKLPTRCSLVPCTT